MARTKRALASTLATVALSGSLVACVPAASRVHAPPTIDTLQAAGRVFHDRNGNGVLDARERGVSNVAVSNGRDVVRTDRKGRYTLPVDPEEAVVFVVKPRGWATPVSSQGIPHFAYIHKPAGSPSDLLFPGVAPTGPLPASIDFPLTRRREPDAFRMVVFGDTQTATREEVDLLARDVVAELVGVDAAFGVTLGDVVNDDLSLLDAVNAVVAGIGVPWYNVHGNHDMNYRADSDSHSDETWERVYGPSTYAFEYGPVHFIVLDDVIYQGWNREADEPGGYRGGLTDDALAFVRAYLAGVPRKHLVVLLMHIPLAPPAGFQVPSGYQVPERRELFRILSRFPHTFSLSSHMHVQYHQFLGPEEGWQRQEPHHHLVQATACGSWWRGERDELGIPHTTMRDGTPNGYSIVTFDGSDYAVHFQAARRPDHHQMRIVAPDRVDAADTAETEVSVNVFAGSERSRVEMHVGNLEASGEKRGWTPLRRVDREDPTAAEIHAREKSTPAGLPLPPVPSPHLWVGNLPADLATGTTAIHIRETDMFGRVSRAHRLIRIE